MKSRDGILKIHEPGRMFFAKESTCLPAYKETSSLQQTLCLSLQLFFPKEAYFF